MGCIKGQYEVNKIFNSKPYNDIPVESQNKYIQTWKCAQYVPFD